MSKRHFDPYIDEEDGAPDRTMCGVIPPGYEYFFTGHWSEVTCARCITQREKLEAMVASTEACIIEQMGAFVDAQEAGDA
jgi:hypothetical protein